MVVSTRRSRRGASTRRAHAGEATRLRGHAQPHRKAPIIDGDMKRLLDVAHCTSDGIAQALDVSVKPIIYSHGHMISTSPHWTLSGVRAGDIGFACPPRRGKRRRHRHLTAGPAIRVARVVCSRTARHRANGRACARRRRDRSFRTGRLDGDPGLRAVRAARRHSREARAQGRRREKCARRQLSQSAASGAYCSGVDGSADHRNNSRVEAVRQAARLDPQ